MGSRWGSRWGPDGGPEGGPNWGSTFCTDPFLTHKTEDTKLCHGTDIDQICGDWRHCGIRHRAHTAFQNQSGGGHSCCHQRFVRALKHPGILLEQYQVH